ncbi:MAG: diacylglycerol kinase [Candidatus Moranbacteria bacterium]|nr:diacylglycerol kinase [Candidatus Moranbacteria bacterium]
MNDNNNERMGSFQKSVRNAFRGLIYVTKTEKNFQMELLAALVVVVLTIFLNVESWEAVILIFLVMWILVAELINTVLEKVVDIMKPRIHPYARIIKDIMAATVLISSIFSLAVGVIIFWPYIEKLL